LLLSKSKIFSRSSASLSSTIFKVSVFFLNIDSISRHQAWRRRVLNCITCIVFVIQPVCSAQLIKDRRQSIPITLKKKSFTL
jgi:hypothetical protein